MAEEQASELQATPGTDVFISYASHDKAVAESVCKALESAGVVCWIAPRDVVPGESFAGAIVHAIDATKVIVLVLSEHSATSQHVLREVERASSKRHPVIAFRIDLAPMPADLEYFLNTSQWLDASDGETRSALPKLLEAVRRQLSFPSAIDPTKSGDTAPAAPGIPPGLSARARSIRRLPRTAIALGAVIAIGLTYFAAAKLWSSKSPTNGQPAAVTAATTPAAPLISDKSIAVLPFADMSEKHDQEYFGDGMAEEILDLLAKIPGLHVPARTSSFYFKGKSEDIPTIARRLLVANVLEGSVRKSGNHVRVTVQLVQADNGYHLWSETYDRTLNDLFKVQDEIAGEVVKALKVSMDANTAPRPVPTNSAEAHRLLLQAQFWYNRGTVNDFRRAASYYQQAIDQDPDFAAAWAGLSQALSGEGGYGGPKWQRINEQALHAAERAIALDPKLAEAHVAQGAARWQEWDWPAANTEFERARAFDPDNAGALNGAGGIAAIHGRLADALRLWEQAAARDPLNFNADANLAYAYYAMGRYKDALTAMRKSEELAPNVEGNHAILAQLLLGTGQNDDALIEAEKESDPGFRAYGLARIYIVLGRRDDADKALAELERSFAAEQPYNIASLHAFRGERDQAFSWLNRAYQLHDPVIAGYPPITVDPDMRNLHGDPRWAAFLRKMNLPE